jgi:hypothetical protein
VLKDLAAAYAQGQRPTLVEVIQSSGLSQSEVDQIAIIAFLDLGDVRDAELAGDAADFFHAYLHRVMMVLSGELITGDNATFSFGGWFELATSGVGGTFSKTPYAVKLWIVDGDKVEDGPTLVSGYVGTDLVVFYLDRGAPTARMPYFVPDFLRRSGRTSWRGEAPDKEHAFEFHIVRFVNQKRNAFIWLEGSQRAITMEVSRDSLHWGVDPEFMKVFMKELHEGGSVGTRLSRLSTWKG